MGTRSRSRPILVLLAFLSTLAFPGFAIVIVRLDDGGSAEGNFNPIPIRGSMKQTIGRAALSVSFGNSSTLSNFHVTLDGTRTGLTNFKLFTTVDPFLDNGDVQ